MEKKEPPPLKLLILLSGNGSTFQAIQDTILAGRLHAKIVAVISDQAKAYGLIRAQQAAIPSVVVPRLTTETREHYDKKLLATLQTYNAELILLAGFMRIVGPLLVKAWQGKLLNIHPSLLPKHPGLHTHERALEAKDRWHGSSVHFVSDELDGGPVIAQAHCPILATDTPQSLEARVKQLEYRLYPKVIEWFAEKRVQLTAQGVMLDNKRVTFPLII